MMDNSAGTGGGHSLVPGQRYPGAHNDSNPYGVMNGANDNNQISQEDAEYDDEDEEHDNDDGEEAYGRPSSDALYGAG